MGFVPSSSTIQLYAYFTEYAREMIFKGDIPDFRVAKFSLHDDDVDYKVTTNSNGTVNQPLTSGFIPDSTGDNDICIKSNKNSIILGKNTLTGKTDLATTTVLGCTDPSANNYNYLATEDDGTCTYNQPGRTLTIGFTNTTFTDPVLGTTKTHSHNFYTFLKVLVGDNSGGPTQAEGQASAFNITVLDWDSTLIETIPVIAPSNPVIFPSGDSILCTLSFRKKNIPPNPDPGYSEATTIKLGITPISPNRTIEPGKGIYEYTKTLVWN